MYYLFIVQNPNEEIAGPSKRPDNDGGKGEDAPYDVTAPINRQANNRRSLNKTSTGFSATSEWVRDYV